LQNTFDTVFARIRFQTQPERVSANLLTTHLPGLRVLDTKMLPPEAAELISGATQSGKPVRVENDLDAVVGFRAQLQRLRSLGSLLTGGANRQEVQSRSEDNRMVVRCNNIKANIRGYGDFYPLGDGRPLLTLKASQWFYTGQLRFDDNVVSLSPDARATSITLGYPLPDGSRTDLTVVHALYPYDDKVETDSVTHIGDYWSGIPNEPFGDTNVSSGAMMLRAFEALSNARAYEQANLVEIRKTPRRES
jgi:hypothetical protein